MMQVVEMNWVCDLYYDVLQNSLNALSCSNENGSWIVGTVLY